MSKYDFKRIEKKWQKKWKEGGIYELDLNKAQEPFYNLMMFPYPSAEGLHVGNMYAFVGSDIYGRFKRMQGYDVFQPIGLDGFGIHSENYALKIGAHPAKKAKISEKRFYKQLEAIGNGFAWSEKLETYDPNYYKWTQWIFIQLFKNGLAYRKKQAVNWCPSCKTVLADEQVISGNCERCGIEVVKKDLEQWFFRITKYADKLLKNLEKLDWSEKVKIAQRNWIGESKGAEIDFKIKNSVRQIKVFTTRPDTLFGATYLVLSPEHELLKNNELRIKNYEEVENYINTARKKSESERAEFKEKTGIELKGIKAINPANKKEIPIFVADYILSSYGTGAIMAVPAHDERDFQFAKKFKLPITKVIEPPALQNFVRNAEDVAAGARTALKIEGDCYEGDGFLVNSGEFNGMDSERARQEITKLVGGDRKTQYRLRDWLISRQRYWGVPIPIIFCAKCDWQPVPEKDLPVKLPFVEDFRPKGKGESPLATVKSFYEVKCPKCGGKARRETDVSDTFLDSAWYYIGFLAKTANSKFEIRNSKFRQRAKRWLPVDMYIGGAEHSVLHLLYSRFIAMVLKDMKVLDFSAKGGSASGGEEPFKKFRAHGLLIKEGGKMSKSKGNIVNPDEYIKNFGADVLRMYLMFLAPFEQGGDFRDEGILGPERFLRRVYNFFERNKGKFFSPHAELENAKTKRQLAKSIKKITEDVENLHYNTAISTFMTLLYYFEADNKTNRADAEIFLKLLAPLAPHLTEEIWRGILENKTSIHKEKWPEYDARLIEEKTFELVVQINGKHRVNVPANVGLNQKEAEKLVLSNERVKNLLANKKIKKVVFVPNRLINFVLELE